jgi:MscS family membrane protein
LGSFIWLTALGFMVAVLEARFGLNDIFAAFQRLQPVLQITILVWFFLRLNRLIFKEVLLSQSQLTTANRDLGQKLVTIIVFFIAVLLLLPHFGVSPASLLTVGGISSLVVGFAAKDMLANYIGAIMLHFDQPFRIGDWVRIRERDIEGIVETIGWRQVVIRDLKKQPIYVPNSLFGTIIVENPGRMTHRRIKEYITVRYQDLKHVPAIVANIQTYLETCGYFDSTQGIVVRFEKFGASSLDIYVSAFSTTIEFPAYMKLREEVMLKIASIVSEQGANFAYPTQTVLMAKSTD